MSINPTRCRRRRMALSLSLVLSWEIGRCEKIEHRYKSLSLFSFAGRMSRGNPLTSRSKGKITRHNLIRYSVTALNMQEKKVNMPIFTLRLASNRIVAHARRWFSLIIFIYHSLLFSFALAMNRDVMIIWSHLPRVSAGFGLDRVDEI